MKQDFFNFITALMEAAPDVVEEKMTKEIREYLDLLFEDNKEHPAISENGKKILDYMIESEKSVLKCKEIADGLGLNSRSVSGSLRRLVDDKFVEKIGISPIAYTLTEKGKNYKENN